MRPLPAVVCAASAVMWLVATLPAVATPGDPPVAAQGREVSFRNCSAAAHIKIQKRANDAPWSTVPRPDAQVLPVSQPSVEPRITSVPAAVVVGGLLLASLGLTQRLRRIRATRD